jgi:hypothetical protein
MGWGISRGRRPETLATEVSRHVPCKGEVSAALLVFKQSRAYFDLMNVFSLASPRHQKAREEGFDSGHFGGLVCTFLFFFLSGVFVFRVGAMGVGWVCY